jgi:hypothetical protein
VLDMGSDNFGTCLQSCDVDPVRAGWRIPGQPGSAAPEKCRCPARVASLGMRNADS